MVKSCSAFKKIFLLCALLAGSVAFCATETLVTAKAVSNDLQWESFASDLPQKADLSEIPLGGVSVYNYDGCVFAIGPRGYGHEKAVTNNPIYFATLNQDSSERKFNAHLLLPSVVPAAQIDHQTPFSAAFDDQFLYVFYRRTDGFMGVDKFVIAITSDGSRTLKPANYSYLGNDGVFVAKQTPSAILKEVKPQTGFRFSVHLMKTGSANESRWNIFSMEDNKMVIHSYRKGIDGYPDKNAVTLKRFGRTDKKPVDDVFPAYWKSGFFNGICQGFSVVKYFDRKTQGDNVVAGDYRIMIAMRNDNQISIGGATVMGDGGLKLDPSVETTGTTMANYRTDRANYAPVLFAPSDGYIHMYYVDKVDENHRLGKIGYAHNFEKFYSIKDKKWLGKGELPPTNNPKLQWVDGKNAWVYHFHCNKPVDIDQYGINNYYVDISETLQPVEYASMTIDPGHPNKYLATMRRVYVVPSIIRYKDGSYYNESSKYYKNCWPFWYGTALNRYHKSLEDISLDSDFVQMLDRPAELSGFVEGAPPFPAGNLRLLVSKAPNEANNDWAQRARQERDRTQGLLAGISVLSHETETSLENTCSRDTDKSIKALVEGNYGGFAYKVDTSYGFLSGGETKSEVSLTNRYEVESGGEFVGDEKAPVSIDKVDYYRYDYEPYNSGTVYVISCQQPVYALRIKGTKEFLSYYMAPPNDPVVDTISYPINENYQRQGDLSTYYKSDIASLTLYAKSAEARRQLVYQDYNVRTFEKISDEDKKILFNANLFAYNSWSGNGKFQSEAKASFCESATLGGNFNILGMAGYEHEAPLHLWKLTAMGGYEYNVTSKKTKEEKSTSSLSSAIDTRYLEVSKSTVVKDDVVTGYGFYTYYREPLQDNFDEFFSTIIDQEWLTSDTSTEAETLRKLAVSRKPVWRVCYRVKSYTPLDGKTASLSLSPAEKNLLKVEEEKSSKKMVARDLPKVKSKFRFTLPKPMKKKKDNGKNKKD
ncbi:MAG: hypothetical protein HQM10_16815 [Candidatus Riflebacteria bacterium]|nr:hypothetical protein [Candidatus Riflebacteria bacterium]